MVDYWKCWGCGDIICYQSTVPNVCENCRERAENESGGLAGLYKRCETEAWPLKPTTQAKAKEK